MGAAATIQPWVVGGDAVVVVGFQGRIEAITDDVVTICGHTVPRRLDHDSGVRYLSMVWPDEPREVEVSCMECDTVKQEADRDAQRLLDLIREEHEDHHIEPWPLCRHALCRAANDA
jgi:hypothetical protein